MVGLHAAHARAANASATSPASHDAALALARNDRQMTKSSYGNLSQNKATRREVGVGRVVLWFLLAGMAIFPRVWIIAFWIFGRAIGDAFSGWIVPLLGFIFVPWTTVLYAWMWAIGSDGVHGWEWIIVAIGLLSDLFFWVAGRASLR
jgi:hypothetical protein